MGSVLEVHSSEDGGAPDNQLLGWRRRGGRLRVRFIDERARECSRFDHDSPRIGDADFAAAENRVDMEDGAAAVYIRASEIQMKAAENGCCFPIPEVLRGDSPLEAAQDDGLVECCVVAAPAAGVDTEK
jgi:hypothetical protein